MVKNCINCGSKVEDEVSFCPGCGADLEKSSSPNAESQTDQTQMYQPIQPKKPKTKLILGLVALIVIVVVILAVVFIFLGGSSGDSRFVGTWNISGGSTGMPSGATMTFESNGDLKMMGMAVGKWSVEGGKICLDITYLSMSSGKQCTSYSFTNGGNTLTIMDPTGGSNNLVLTK